MKTVLEISLPATRKEHFTWLSTGGTPTTGSQHKIGVLCAGIIQHLR